MTDNEPILFRKAFGSLRPVTPAAEQLLRALPDKAVRVEIKNVKGNTKRLAFYFVCLKVGCEQLSDAVDGIMTPRILHRFLKRRCGLSTPIVSKKTGEIVEWDDESIAFEKMSETERAEYIDQALAKLSEWIGCDVTELRAEGEVRFGERSAA
ncbi:hypothetical protein SH584_11305 [Sphingomonas sp. LY29]|uniref:hypothetical protein n=1 Tax=Sphingomonas sp. LY29 TaxID=3095341 RepID=UPI002D79DD8B|nr:hypothetical protein [Sphingomonas sp. LY29]WRP25618.1 hypothetical protein SH584_11305 [Sphingomonas sp. LY29]